MKKNKIIRIPSKVSKDALSLLLEIPNTFDDDFVFIEKFGHITIKDCYRLKWICHPLSVRILRKDYGEISYEEYWKIKNILLNISSDGGALKFISKDILDFLTRKEYEEREGVYDFLRKLLNICVYINVDDGDYYFPPYKGKVMKNVELIEYLKNNYLIYTTEYYMEIDNKIFSSYDISPVGMLYINKLK